LLKNSVIENKISV